MIGTSSILQEEYSQHFTIHQVGLSPEEKNGEFLGLADLELSVIDYETGKGISKAMISIDTQGRTSVCDVHGKVVVQKVLSGNFILDVIVPGYIANSSMIQISVQDQNSLIIKMVRNS